MRNVDRHNTTFVQPSGEIKALTSLRGIAAMAVIMQHFSQTAQQHSAVSIPSLVPHGYLAVDLFFVLSGFIMSYTYLALFQHNGAAAFGDFLLKRIARIVPLNVAALVIILLAGQLSVNFLGKNIFYYSESPFFDIFANLFMLQGLGIGRNLNGPSWSISTEFAAYFAFPIFIAAIFSKHWLRTLLVLLVSISVICWLASKHPRLGLETGNIGDGLLRCFAEFCVGMVSYRFYASARKIQWLGSDGICISIAAGCVIFMCLRIDLPAVLLFPALIISIALNQSRVARFMAHPLLYSLGLISFSVYLLHQPFRPLELELLRAWHPVPLTGPAALLFAFLGSLSVLPLAWVAFRYVERPGREFIRRLAAPNAREAKP
jgi:peptidoglycan/LPS O-acetylase OafA/YrhL